MVRLREFVYYYAQITTSLNFILTLIMEGVFLQACFYKTSEYNFTTQDCVIINAFAA